MLTLQTLQSPYFKLQCPTCKLQYLHWTFQCPDCTFQGTHYTFQLCSSHFEYSIMHIGILALIVPHMRSAGMLQLQVPKTRLVTYGDRSFESVAPRLWNSLPFDIRNSKSMDFFKRKLKTYFFKQHFKCYCLAYLCMHYLF